MHHIIFVDDEPNVLHGLRRMLHAVSKDWELVFAGSAHEALAAMETHGAFDILVSDMQMPDMNGVDLFLTVKERYPETVRFALSGEADAELLLRASAFTHQYLTKPCDPRHLQFLLSRSLALRSHFKNSALIKKLNAMGAIPSIPAVYQEIIGEMEGPDPSVKRVAQAIEKDASLSAKVLQIVNSAYIGLRYEVSSLQQAASLMGIDRLRSLVLMAEIFKPEKTKGFSKYFNLDALWNHSLKVGACARAIAETETDDRKLIEKSYTAGLLHDLGLIVLASALPEEFALVLDHCNTRKQPIFDAEQEVLGTTHAEVGGYLLELWGLPDTVVEAIAFHHYPSGFPEAALLAMDDPPAFHPLTAVHVANYFCSDSVSNSGDLEDFSLDAYYLEQMKVPDRVSDWWDACGDLLA